MTNGMVLNRVEIGPDVEVKFVRRHACRLVSEEGSLRLYFNSENSMEYHGVGANYVALPEKAGPAVDYLLTKYPEFTRVEDIPIKNQERKVKTFISLEIGLLRSTFAIFPPV